VRRVDLHELHEQHVVDDVARRLDAVAHRVGDVFVRLIADVSPDHWHVRSAVPCRPDAPSTRAVAVADALAALQALGDVDSHVSRLVRRLVRMLLPRVAAAAELAIVDERLVVSAASAASAATLERALAAARVLVQYARLRLPAPLFEATLAKLAPELVAVLAPLLDFERFAEQRELVADFERAVADIGLTARLADGEQRHAARLHAAALEQVRAAVMAPSYPNPNETVDVATHAQLDREQRVAALLNAASPWRVTSVAQRLAAQVADASPALALDIVTLYGCAVRLRAAPIAAVPAQALLLLADVQHVVRVVRSRGASLSVVLQLRALEQEADAVFEAVCVAQCAQIDESWATADGAANTNAPARQQSVSRACQRIELQLTRLARALADTGPRNAAAQIVARAARHARDVVSGAVLALKDIAADECTALQTTLAPLAAALDTLLLGESNRLRAVVDVLPMSILELHAALPRLSKALSARELTHLVSAMFQQSEKRSKLLAQLSAHE